MGYTDTEKQEILAGVPENVKNQARQGDRDAINLIKGRISEWKSGTSLPQSQAPQSISDRSRVLDLANQGNFNWDEISGLIDSGKLTDEVVEFFASQGYGLEQSITGGRIINIGKKGKYLSSPQGRMLSKLGESVSSFVTIPWRGLGENDPTSMSKDDFYRYLLKQPKGDWARTGVEKLIKKQLQERQELDQKAYATYGEAANVDLHGKAGALTQKHEIPVPTPQDWFPKKFVRGENGAYSANKSELQRYKSVILENDPYAAAQVEQLSGREVADFYYAQKQEDSRMMERLDQLQAKGRTHLNDPEVYDWFVRRGMEKTQDITLGQAVEAGWDILGQVWQGFVGSEDGHGIIKEFGDTIFKDELEEYQEFDQLVGESFRALGSDYQLLSENAGGYFLDLIEKADDKDSPEVKELYRKAKSERNRKFQLRALSNQAVYERASQDIALKQGKNPQQMQKNILTGTFTFDPMNFVPLGGVSKKGADAALRTGVNALNDGALKTAKIAADEASQAISDAQRILVDAVNAGDGAAVQTAKKSYDDAVKQYDDAEKALKEASTKVDNIYQELLEAGTPKLSGKALEMMGATAEWIMKKGDELLDAAAMKLAPDMADGTRRMLEGGVKMGVAATVGGASLGTVGAVVGGVLLGSPLARAFARDIRLMGSHIALGARLQPLHRALRATTDAGGNVTAPVSRGTGAALHAYELAFPLVDPVARLGSRVVKGVASIQTAEAMAIQAAIGFLGSGGTWQGAVTGGTMGFGLAGSFGAAGSLTPFGSQRQVNQLAATNARHYRNMLEGTPTGDEFAKLRFDYQKAIAWAMGGFTDTALKIINDPNAPAGSYNNVRNEININVGRREWTQEFAQNVAKHEHSHYIARHVGVREKLLKTLLADDFSLQSGIFAKKGKDGKALYRLDRDTIREIMRKNTQGKSVDEVMQELRLSREAVESLGRTLTVGDRRRNDVYIETTDDFKDITNTYLSKLAASNPFAAIDLINKGERYVQEYIAEEIFAEQGAAEIANYTPAYAKTFRRASWMKDLDAALNNPRFSGRKASVLGRIGALFGSDQKINSSILGSFDSIPEFKEIFDGYNHSRSMNREMQLAESTSEGIAPSEILDPRDWDPSVNTPSTESLKAWVANGMLDIDPSTGVPRGIEVQADGEWRVRDPSLIRQTSQKAEAAAKEFGAEIKDWLETNTPPPKSAQEIKDIIETQAPPKSQAEKDALDAVKQEIDGGVKKDVDKEIRTQKAQSIQSTKDYLDDISQIIDDNMVDDDVVAPRVTLNGRTVIAGRYLPEGLLSHLEKSGRFNPHQLQNLKNLNQYLKDGLHATPITVMYQSATKAGKAKAIAAAEKTVYVTGFEVTQQGNFIYRIWNIDKIMTNGGKKMNSKIGQQLYNGDIGQFYQDVYTYFNNYAKGLPGATGLSATKRDFIRKAIGLGDPQADPNSGRTANPYSWNVQPLKDTRDTALNSYRLDRTNWIDLGNPRMKKPLDAPLTSREGPNPGSYQRIRENFHPGDIDYLDAVESGDMETAQKMVDEAAKRAGWTVLAWHGTTRGALKGNKFDPSKQQRGFITSAGYFTTDKRAAVGYATSGGAGYHPKGSKERKALEGGERLYDPSLYRVYLKGDWWKGNIDIDALVEAVNTVNDRGISDEFDLEWTSTWDDKEGYASRNDSYPDVVFDTPEEWLRDFVEKGEFDSYVGNDTDAIGSESPIAFVFSNWEVGKKYLEITGKDGVAYFDKETTAVDTFSDNATTYVPTNPNQIKSADPVTYDDSGNVIPLSERFNPKSDDIRYFPGVDNSIIDEAYVKKLEGVKKQIAKNLGMADYPANPIEDSIALPARMGIVSQSAPGMPRSYKDAVDLVYRMVDRILYVKDVDPEFARRSAMFYYDMATSAIGLAESAAVEGRGLYDLADLQLRFLALGSPRTGVASNASKSARSVMSPHGVTAGHKLGFGSQQRGAKFAKDAWDKGEYYNTSNENSGADDKVRNFYLNSLAELIDIALEKGDVDSANMLRERAAKTLELIKPDEKLSEKVGKELDRFLDGLATVDMWDMAAKGQAHPAYIPRNKREKQAKGAFFWSVPKQRRKTNLKDRKWKQALEDISTDKRKVESIEDLVWQEARALQIDGKDWNKESWAARLEEGGFTDATEWSYYNKADEGGLSPGGSGRLYDAQQSIDGMIADVLNGMGLAGFYGKKKLKARNAQEILWAIEKLANPLPSNQELVLFGDRLQDFFDKMRELRTTGKFTKRSDKDPGLRTLEIINDTYARLHTQSMPFEFDTWGTTDRAKTAQEARDKVGVQNATEQFAYGLKDQFQAISDTHDMGVTFLDVRVSKGGYLANDGTYAQTPNIVVTMRGNPDMTQVFNHGSQVGLDQEAGNIFRQPTIEELNNPNTHFNEALTMDTKHLSEAEAVALATDLATILDSDGTAILTGYTITDEGMTIGNQYYDWDKNAPPRFSDELSLKFDDLKNILIKHGITKWEIGELIIDVTKRADEKLGREVESYDYPSKQPEGWHPAEREIIKLMQAKAKGITEVRDMSNLLEDEAASRLQQRQDRAVSVRGATQDGNSKSFTSAQAKGNAVIEAKAAVDILILEGLITEDQGKQLKEQVDENYKDVDVYSPDQLPRSINRSIKARIKSLRADTQNKKKTMTSRLESLKVLAQLADFTPERTLKEAKRIVPKPKSRQSLKDWESHAGKKAKDILGSLLTQIE